MAGGVGGDLLYDGRVHVHRGDPILAHDRAGLVLRGRGVAHVSGKQKGAAGPRLGGAG